MELKGINIEKTKSANIADDNFVLVRLSLQPAKAENKIIILTLSEANNTVFKKLRM